MDAARRLAYDKYLVTFPLNSSHSFFFYFGTRPTTSNTMRLSHFGAGALFALNSGIANAQFPPKPEGLKVLESGFGDGVQISYKEVGIHNP